MILQKTPKTPLQKKDDINNLTTHENRTKNEVTLPSKNI